MEIDFTIFHHPRPISERNNTGIASPQPIHMGTNMTALHGTNWGTDIKTIYTKPNPLCIDVCTKGTQSTTCLQVYYAQRYSKSIPQPSTHHESKSPQHPQEYLSLSSVTSLPSPECCTTSTKPTYTQSRGFCRTKRSLDEIHIKITVLESTSHLKSHLPSIYIYTGNTLAHAPSPALILPLP
jgi:hypothetical protein